MTDAIMAQHKNNYGLGSRVCWVWHPEDGQHMAH